MPGPMVNAWAMMMNKTNVLPLLVELMGKGGGWALNRLSLK